MASPRVLLPERMAIMGIYYNPEDYGLTVIGEVERGEPYQWDGVVAWKHEDGRVLAGKDSVCSCYSPFEWCDGVEDLLHITDAAQIGALLDDAYFDVSAPDRADLLNAVRKELS